MKDTEAQMISLSKRQPKNQGAYTSTSIAWPVNIKV